MGSGRSDLFTQGCADDKNQPVTNAELVPLVQWRSSAVEHCPHTTAVAGSIPAATTNTLSPLDVARFWSKVDVGSDHVCWPWQGRRNQRGYGRFRETVAHRVACELVHGPASPELFVLHSCDNPPCCNPRHLRWGTHQDNVDDAVKRSRTARGEQNSKKLTSEQVEFIRANPDGLTGVALAERFNVAESTISYVRSGRSWKFTAGTVPVAGGWR